MAEPFLGEIRLMSFNFPPKGWTACNGQFLPINQNQALFALLGTTYGGNGQTTFALPDLRGRVPIHFGSGHSLGERAGEEAHTISTAEMPQHTHTLTGTQVVASTDSPAGALLASSSNLYGTGDGASTLRPVSMSHVGGSQPHQNMQPFLALGFYIALQGIFPSRN